MTSWIAPLARAVPALVLAIVVTFSADHSATLGLITFGAFAIASGIVLAVFALRTPAGTTRTIPLIQAAVGVLAGIAALTVIGGGIGYLVLLVSAWAVITGVLEVYLGLRSRGTPVSRDYTFVGALTVVLAMVVLIIPPDLVQQFTGPDGVPRELTTSIIVVGVLGAYWAILGVFLVIAAFSLKGAPAPRTEVEEP